MKSDEFLDLAGVSEKWIIERTGIHERRVLGPKESNSDIATKASIQALHRAGLSPDKLSLILGCTNSPDRWMPGMAAAVLAKLGCAPGKALAFDLVSACSGWLTGLKTADSFVRSGAYENVLVIGSEGFTRLLNWKEPSTCVLFADGAGACIVSAGDQRSTDGKILDVQLYTDGNQAEILELVSAETYLPLGAPLVDAGAELHLAMDKERVFLQAVRGMVAACHDVLSRCGFTIQNVDWLIPHQANIWIIKAVGEKLGIPESKVAVNIDKYGNTIAATIPTCFDQYVASGKIKRGDLVLMTVFGAGATWGAGLVRW